MRNTEVLPHLRKERDGEKERNHAFSFCHASFWNPIFKELLDSYQEMNQSMACGEELLSAYNG